MISTGIPGEKFKVFLEVQRHPPPGAWTDNRLAQSQHYTGTLFLALNAVLQAMASASMRPAVKSRWW